jgi:hypothetical protein
MRLTAMRETRVKLGILRVFHSNQGEGATWRCLWSVNNKLKSHGSGEYSQ